MDAPLLAARPAAAAPVPAPAVREDAVRVLICDDSAVIRGALSRMLENEPGIAVVGRASNGEQAVAQVARQPVDVVLLDIEMPVMDGLTALPLILRASPGVRVIIASTLTTRGAEVALRALRLGAADCLPKPSAAAMSGAAGFRAELVASLRGHARLRRAAPVPGKAPTPVPASMLSPTTALRLRPVPAQPPRLLAIGSSTGGPQALLTLVQGLGPRVAVPVVLTQHMPPSFTPILAEHITRLGGLPCAEARDGEPLLPGRIYLAPGDRHLIVAGSAGALQARLSNDPPENFCRPAVDPMLRSAVAAVGGRVLTVMLTGMGHDGLAGTRDVVGAGGGAIAQDEASSVVWGMPGAIAKDGLCHAVLPLPRIAPRVLELLGGAR